LQTGVDLPPVSVVAKPNGTYELQNGYHRFLACALVGFASIPVDQLAAQPQVVAPPVSKYVPPQMRNRK
jgi:hypothetical protein